MGMTKKRSCFYIYSCPIGSSRQKQKGDAERMVPSFCTARSPNHPVGDTTRFYTPHAEIGVVTVGMG